MRQNYYTLGLSIIFLIFILGIIILHNRHFIDMNIGKRSMTDYDLVMIGSLFAYLWARVEIGLYRIRKEYLEGKSND